MRAREVTPARPCFCAVGGAGVCVAGTHCAGIMAARHNNGPGTPVGVLSSASIVSCKFLDRWGSGYTSDALECVDNLLAKGNVGVLSNRWVGAGVLCGSADLAGRRCVQLCPARVLQLTRTNTAARCLQTHSWGGSDPSDALRDALKAACAKGGRGGCAHMRMLAPCCCCTCGFSRLLLGQPVAAS